jgi:NAD(P)-dependent dehydrogenase (short-subunit alcohol dehydrogenase family)
MFIVNLTSYYLFDCWAGHTSLKPCMVTMPGMRLLEHGERSEQGSRLLVHGVLVSGGLGSVGYLAANWMARACPGTSIWLTGRNGRLKHDRPLVPFVHGCLRFTARDLAVAADTEDLVHCAASSAQLCTSILHAGASLHDALLTQQTARTLRITFAPKAQAILRMASAAARMPLRGSILFSSLSAELGTPGQSNYAAANGALEGIAEHLSRAGLQSTSVIWGPWALGMALSNSRATEQFYKAGLELFTGDSRDSVSSFSYRSAKDCYLQKTNAGVSGTRLLYSAMSLMAQHSAVIIANIQWSRLLSQSTGLPPFFAVMKENEDMQSGQAPRKASKASIISADSGIQGGSHRRMRDAAEIKHLVSGVARGLLGEDVPPDQPLMDAGLDSLGVFHVTRLPANPELGFLMCTPEMLT